MPMTLKDFLGYQQLGAVIQATKDGIPDILPKGFSPTPKRAKRDKYTYNIKYGQRRLPQSVVYGAPSVQADQQKIGQMNVQLLHFHEHISFGPEILELLHNMADYSAQEQTIEIISYQLSEFRTKFDNARIATKISALANGKIYLDGNRNVLPNSSGAIETIDLRVPASNIDTIANLSGLASQTTIAGAWSSTATNIPGQIRNVKNAVRRLYGYELDMCIYGRNVPEYLSQNAILNPFEIRDQSFRSEYLAKGELAPSHVFQGLEWYPGYSAFFEKNDGTTPDLVPANTVIFCPKPNPYWYELVEGTYPVPTSFQPQADAMAALKSIKWVQGMFAYAKITDDPIGIKVNCGDTQLPVFRVPGVVMIATVA